MTQPPRLHTLRPTMHSPEPHTHPESPNLSGEPLTGILEVSGQAPESQEHGAGGGGRGGRTTEGPISLSHGHSCDMRAPGPESEKCHPRPRPCS